MTILHEGEKAPEFSLADQSGTVHTLSQYKGKWVFLYFYPKDDTPGCTKEACMIRDDYPNFTKLDAVVFGVSADSVKSHGKFGEKYQLPFTLLSDEEKKTVHDYGVWGEKKFMGRTYMGISRMSFLIDPQGNIAKVYEKVLPPTHAGEVLADLEMFQKMK